MINDQRTITQVLDDGGPSVTREKATRVPFRRGMMLDTSVCDNPAISTISLF
jgi:hypothetical protein